MRLVCQRRVEEAQLLVDRFKIAQRVGAGAVEQVNEHTAALDVAQEFQPKPDALVCAFQQAGDVDQDNLPVVDLGHAQRRLDGGEGIVGDLGPRGADHAQQRRLAGVGHADDADVGHQLKFQFQPQFVARFALFGQARRRIARRLEGGIAAAAAPTLRHDELLPGFGQVGQQFSRVGVAHQRPRRHGQAQIGPVGARAVGAAAVVAPLGAVVYVVLEVEERVQPKIDIEHDVAAAPAGAAIGPATRHILLLAERHHPVAAAACLRIDSCSIIKHGCIVREKAKE